MSKKYKTVEEYILDFPDDIQVVLNRIRRTIIEASPDAVEKISYNMPTFYLNGNLVHFAAYKNHIGFYPTPSAIAAFEDELSSYKNAKGSVQFPLDSPIPYDLIKRMVIFRVQENSRKKVIFKN